MEFKGIGHIHIFKDKINAGKFWDKGMANSSFFPLLPSQSCLHAENLGNIKEIWAMRVKLKNRQLKSFRSTQTQKAHLLSDSTC